MNTPRGRVAEVEDPGSGDTEARIELRVRRGGSGDTTPLSWSSQSPGTPNTLSQLMFREYDPEKEVLERFHSRIRRQAAALAAVGEPLAEGTVLMLLAFL